MYISGNQSAPAHIQNDTGDQTVGHHQHYYRVLMCSGLPMRPTGNRRVIHWWQMLRRRVWR